MIMYLGNPEEYTEDKIKKRIRKEPKCIENYIILSEYYQKNGKGIEEAFKPIKFLETNITNGKFNEDIWARKIDIYCNYGDVSFYKGDYKQALNKYYIAWSLAKEYIEEEKIETILDYDFEVISEYSLSELIYSINISHKKLGKEFQRDNNKFKKEVWNLLKLKI